MSKAVRILAPIKGALGNEVQVGDTVMVVTTGYSHRSTCSRGKYVGYIEGTGYYKKRAQIEIECTGYKRLWNDTKEEFTYGGAREKALYTDYATYSKNLNEQTHIVEHKYTRISTLNLNRIATLKD
jgi:hypothetical protein